MAAVDFTKMAPTVNKILVNDENLNTNNNSIHKQFVALDEKPKVDITDRFISNSHLDCIKNKMADVDLNRNQQYSEIQQFYHGKSVLITGGTGFLGKILVEKLLRRCPGVETLYLLVRQKRGKDIYSRIEEIFDDPVFNLLKEEVPKFRHKVVVVSADCESPGLGLSLEDRQMLIEKVNIIFHSAATVKFDEQLRSALGTNVRGPLQLLQLAKHMKELEALMHISTAYSNPHLPKIEERFYTCNSSYDQLFDMVEKFTQDQIDGILNKIMGPWPNTYTFTKALAETQLKENAENVPLGIFRPAIVTSTAKEPLKCWIDNMYGPTGVSVGSATGILRTLYCAEDVTADIVPVDYVVNCLLAASVSVFKTYKQSPPLEPPIFNYVSSVENPITWGDFMRQNISRLEKYPMSNAIWYISLHLNRNYVTNMMKIFFLHLVPGALTDAVTMLVGRKPRMLKVYRKIHKFSAVISYFSTREIQFCNKNTRDLWQKTGDLDRQLFPFSMAEVDWNEYFEEYMAGIRRYIFKDSDDTLPQARIKWKRLYYLHQTVKYLFISLMLYVFWSALKPWF